MDRVQEHHFRFDLFLAIIALILLGLFYLDRQLYNGRFFATVTQTQRRLGEASEPDNVVKSKTLGFRFEIPKGYSAEKCGNFDEELLVYVYQTRSVISLCDGDENPTFTATKKRRLDDELRLLKSDPTVKESDQTIFGQKAKHLNAPGLNQYLIEKNNTLYVIQDPSLIIDLILK